MQDFDWDDANVDHIAKHGVSPTEAEDAILDRDRSRAPARSTPTEKRRGIVGATEHGRVPFVSYTSRDGAFRAVTAFDPSESLRRRYRRRSDDDT